MRITTRMLSDRILHDIQAAGQRALDLQHQIATGRKINRPSDDPTGTALAMRYVDRIGDIEQFDRNIGMALDRLSATENAVTTAQDLLTRASVLAEQGANDSLGAPERAGLAKEVDQLLEEMLASANIRNESGHLFGGRAENAPAFSATRNAQNQVTAVAAAVTVDDVLVRQVDSNETVTLNIKAGEVFGTSGGGAINLFQQLIDLRDRLNANDGNGIRSMITILSDGHRQVAEELTVIGSRVRRLHELKTRFGSETVQNEAARSRLEDASVSEAIVRLQAEQTTLQAALQTGARILRMSLLDYLG